MVRYPFQRTNVLNLFFRIEENSTSIPLEEINTSSSNFSALGRPFVSNFPHPRNRQWSNAQGHLGEDVEALNWLRLYLLQNKLSLRSIFVESSSLPNQGSCHLILSVSHLSQSTSHFICFSLRGRCCWTILHHLFLKSVSQFTHFQKVAYIFRVCNWKSVSTLTYLNYCWGCRFLVNLFLFRGSFSLHTIISWCQSP